MEKGIEKTIDIKNGKIKYFENEAYVTFYGITYFVEDKEGNLEKSIKFNMWDDFSFSAYTRDKSQENNSLEFKIEEDNIIYECINKFLGKEMQITLQDDESRR